MCGFLPTKSANNNDSTALEILEKFCFHLPLSTLFFSYKITKTENKFGLA